MYVSDIQNHREAGGEDGEMSGRIACVQQVEIDMCVSVENREGRIWHTLLDHLWGKNDFFDFS